ncbi:acyl-CoA dehydrogenase [Mycolicibacterium septicum DSM 44393]|uniref:Acyl-CoA dehydrogenase n=1 Tax=Mycolicibacterium septicum DSM 44393 TaxID=1341646 RepID=A0A7X6MSI7_9MYCO|nr:acyl-CoA dehydrogenase [Mycolicibacterium septicum]NKZ13233.1 acyl-CoA dehydrogenase [Mycolicibacterium septicum DSM 44393]
MTAGLVRSWLESGRLDLPLPGSGATVRRWQRLAELAEIDVVAGRLAEAHVDAVAILDELGAKPPAPGELWAVWAAEDPDAVLNAHTTGDSETEAVRLSGTKAWCSGAGFCTHALVTARLGDGQRALYAVETSSRGVRPLPSTWRNPGMAASDTRSVQFSGAAAVPVGSPGDYLDRPGFWHGAIGVAACWVGAARAVAGPLYDRAARGAADAHVLAHLGAVDAAIAAADAMLAAAAEAIDADPFDRSGSAQLLARRTRAVAETAVDTAITRTGRALGPAPLCQDAQHARRVADLTIYVRQSHAERDLAALGKLAGERR